MRRTICTLLGLIVTIWTFGDDSDSGYYYYFFDERVDLIADPDTIAILDEDGVGPEDLSPEDLSELLSDAGYPGFALQQLIPSLWLAGLRSASDPPVIEDVATVISKLIRFDRQAQYFFSPVLSGDRGGWLIILPSVVAKFEREVTDQRIEELLALAGADGADKQPFGGLENTFKITNDFRSGIEVLDVANCLAVLPEVVYAEPSFLSSGSSAGGPAELPEVPTLSISGLLILSLIVVVTALVVQRRIPRSHGG